MEQQPYMYRRDRVAVASLRNRLAAGGFTRVERQQPVSEWYRPFLGPGAVYVHIPQQLPPSVESVDIRRLPPPPPPASRPRSTPVRVTQSR